MEDAFAPLQVVPPHPNEQKNSENSLASHVSATESLSFDHPSALTNLVISPPKAETKRASIPLQMWTPAPPVSPQPLPGIEESRFQQIMRYSMERSLYRKPLGEIVQAIAQQLLGSSYHANLLDKSSQEGLVVSLTRFDCVLFVETVLSLAQGVAEQDYSYPTFATHLQEQRYRGGNQQGYCSRLHYFSDWIADNQRRGNIQNMAPELGGVSIQKVLNFMSTHRYNYPRLVNDGQSYACIRKMEASLNPLTLHYVPQSQVHRIYHRLQPGDVVAIATTIPGLDVTHTGLLYRNTSGGIGLIHAAPDRGIMLSPDLQSYLNRIPDAAGLLVARPRDTRH